VLVHLACGPEASAEALAAEIGAQARGPRSEQACTLWLESPELLAPAVQRRVEGWIDYGPPAGSVRTARLRWVGTVDEREEPGRRLEPGLLRALAGVAIRIPPLRERLVFLPNLANNTASAWCAARGEPTRRFGEDALTALEEYPWPGNLGELDAVVAQSLARGTRNPIGPDDLRLDGHPLAPLEAGLMGAFDEEPLEPGHRAARSELDLVEDFEETEDDSELPEADVLEDEEELETLVLPEPEPEPPAAASPPAAPAALAPAGVAPVSDTTLRRLADAVSHEVRNPLTAIRTFAELLPERYGDHEFRTRFARHVTEGVQRVDRVVEGLAHFAGLGPPDRKPVDVSALLEEALDARRQRIRDRHLLVLKELDPEHPLALCDPEQMRFAFEAMLDRALEMLPERGDLYLASRRHPAGLRGGPSVRVLLRLQTPGRAAAAPGQGLSPAENSLGFAIAEAVARAQGGTTAIDAGDPAETVILMDLPAPAAAAHP
jgi:hypothetical protein